MKDKDKAIQMIRDGVPYREITEVTGYSQGYLYKMASDAGIVRHRISIEDYREQIYYMLEQGKTAEEIGQALGYSRITINHYLNEKRKEEKRRKKQSGQEETEEIVFPEEQLGFVERKAFRGPVVEYQGKKYQDVTEICCPG